MPFFDPMYFVFALPAMVLGMWAQFKVKSAFGKYAEVQAATGITGAIAARRILDARGLDHVAVERVEGFLSDHYDPGARVLRLSPEVYDQSSLAAVGVAAHEAGHALQHQEQYLPLQFRSAVVPGVQIGSWLGPIIFTVGLFMSGFAGNTIAWVGIGLFGLTALFTLITLPVEFDASARAKQILVADGVVSRTELNGVATVLDAAALTYVAAAIQAISTLVYYVYVLNRRN
ncbi:MAG: zinc metallopeptidase [Pseudanabaenaceae cyanobacterium bins.68]|nr:zinc metallopeptidase [Pseudanabaenaceae cyanobacterium bins.68]